MIINISMLSFNDEIDRKICYAKTKNTNLPKENV